MKNRAKLLQFLHIRKKLTKISSKKNIILYFGSTNKPIVLA